MLPLKPDRFAVFNYAHVPWMKPAQKILKRRCCPSPETKLELLKLTIERLTSEGYVYIGMDHFARATTNWPWRSGRKRLQRNFQGYSTRGGADIYAFGMSSISQAEGFYWQNHKELPAYYARWTKAQLPLHRGLHHDGGGQAPAHHHHAADVRLGPGLRRHVESARAGFRAAFRGTNSASLDDMEADGLVERNATWPPGDGSGPAAHSQYRHALRRLRHRRGGKTGFRKTI